MTTASFLKVIRNSVGWNVLAFILLICQFSLAQQPDCVLKKDADSIRVYSCSAGQSKFRSVRASFTVIATAAQMTNMLVDIGTYVKWQYNTVQASVLKKISDHEMIYYIEIAAPWPISHRDMVTHFDLRQDSRTGVITVTADGVPEFIPEVKNLIRVPFSRSQWTIVPQSPGILKVDYAIQIDPGGSVPAWMVNMVSAQAPYESFRKLKEKIRNYSSHP